MISSGEEDPILYKALFEQKDKEVRELNREIGKLNYKIELIENINNNSALSMVAEKDINYKKDKKK